jgi:hypothetical protein
MLSSEKPPDTQRLPDAPGARAAHTLGALSVAWPFANGLVLYPVSIMVSGLLATRTSAGYSARSGFMLGLPIMLSMVLHFAGSVPGIIGIVLASRARARTSASHGQLGGESNAIAGLVMSIVGVALPFMIAVTILPWLYFVFRDFGVN